MEDTETETPVTQIMNYPSSRDGMIWNAIELFKAVNGGRIMSADDAADCVITIAEKMYKFVTEGETK